MWTKLSHKNQMENIKIGDYVMRHPSDDKAPLENPIGNEFNSDTYKVVLRTTDSLSLQLLTGVKEFEGMALSMTRQVSYIDLLNGLWWVTTQRP